MPPASDQKEYNKRQCVLEELINIFPVYDMADEAGRSGLQNLLYDSLTGIVFDFIFYEYIGIIRMRLINFYRKVTSNRLILKLSEQS